MCALLPVQWLWLPHFPRLFSDTCRMLQNKNSTASKMTASSASTAKSRNSRASNKSGGSKFNASGGNASAQSGAGSQGYCLLFCCTRRVARIRLRVRSFPYACKRDAFLLVHLPARGMRSCKRDAFLLVHLTCTRAGNVEHRRWAGRLVYCSAIVSTVYQSTGQLGIFSFFPYPQHALSFYSVL